MTSLSIPLRECRVLLADDDALVRAVYADTLRAVGCQVTEAANGGEAVVLAPTLMPDLVLMDLSMPMVDGWQALEALRAEPSTHALVVVALTAEVIAGVALEGAGAIFPLFAEVIRGIVLAAILWGAGDLTILLIDVGHDVRAARVLLGRISARAAQQANDRDTPV